VSRDLKETMLHAAASTYGSKHYRGVLAMHGLRKFAPVLWVLVLLAGVAGVGWLLLSPVARTASDNPTLVGGAIVGALIVAGLLFALVKHLRSPYRRRRFR
jgi:hypothetical protein